MTDGLGSERNWSSSAGRGGLGMFRRFHLPQVVNAPVRDRVEYVEPL
jgi:hypothetical protein